MCAFGAFDLRRHGNANWGSPWHAADGMRSRHGKLERSLVTFAAEYPFWHPEGPAAAALGHMARTAAGADLAGEDACDCAWSVRDADMYRWRYMQSFPGDVWLGWHAREQGYGCACRVGRAPARRGRAFRRSLLGGGWPGPLRGRNGGGGGASPGGRGLLTRGLPLATRDAGGCILHDDAPAPGVMAERRRPDCEGIP